MAHEKATDNGTGGPVKQRPGTPIGNNWNPPARPLESRCVPPAFTASADVIEPSTGVQFTLDIVAGSEPFSIVWEFGDGATSTEQNPFHVYGDAGTFNVSVTVANPCGEKTIQAQGNISPIYLVSYLYPVMWEDAANVSHSLLRGAMLSWPFEGLNVSHAMVAGDLRSQLTAYSLWPPEGVDVSHALPAGNMVLVLKAYDLWPPESIGVTHAMLAGGMLSVLLFYDNWLQAVEKLDVTHSLLGGELQ